MSVDILCPRLPVARYQRSGHQSGAGVTRDAVGTWTEAKLLVQLLVVSPLACTVLPGIDTFRDVESTWNVVLPLINILTSLDPNLIHGLDLDLSNNLQFIFD